MRARSTLVLALAVIIGLVPGVASAATWQEGYVFAGAGGGRYIVYDQSGNIVEELPSSHTFAETTGCAFDTNEDFYGTYFQNTVVEKFSQVHPHPIVQTIDTNLHAPNSHSESIVFAANGDFYVGNADGTRDILRYNAAGVFQQAYDVQTDARGSDWIDLAADQQTIFYAGEGRVIKRFNVATNTQLPDFAVLPGGGAAFALRLLPPGDASAGLLVADLGDIKRLDAAGTVVQNYDAPGEDCWFGLNLDPNGTSFWSGNICNGHFYRFNIATGAVELGPIATPTGALAGLCVLGEITAALTAPDFTSPPECGTGVEVEVGELVTLDITAEDQDPGDVTLTVNALPTGATMTPPLPTSGNPVTSQFTWTPGPEFENQIVSITWTATDSDQLTDTCTIRFIVGDDLLVTLTSFGATPGDGRTDLEWVTETEVDNAGFYLLRRNTHSGQIARLHEGLLPAQGDITGGATYHFADETAINGVAYEYVLVDVDLSGLETRHPGALAVVNPQDPPIKLVSPAYDAKIDAGGRLAFGWTSGRRAAATLLVSVDPSFPEGARTFALPVRTMRLDGTGSTTLTRARTRQLEQLALGNGGRLYWRVVETSLGSQVVGSDTFTLSFAGQGASRQYQNDAPAVSRPQRPRRTHRTW